MAIHKRTTASRLLISIVGVLALFSNLTTVSAQTSRITCSASSQCPESSPCCSSEGVCGSGAMQCAGGCNPMASFKPSSCLPNPVCRSRNMTIKPSDYNNKDTFMPILEYNGNASSPFTLDSGTLGAGPEGVLLQLKAAQQAKISSTDYFMYGYVEATLRHDARQGVVAAFILMSDVKDEVDWEFVADGSVGMTNYFRLGVPVLDHGVNVTTPNFNTSEWHTYGLNWTNSQLQWTIDGRVVRTLSRAEAGADYPQTPSRIQLSTWAGGNDTNPEGTIAWAGGPIDWNSPEYKQNGFYSQEIKQFNVQCASIDSLDLTSIPAENSSNGSNPGSANVTSFGYTGANSTSSLGPAFGTSTDPLRILSDPGADGIPGYPGYGAADTGPSGKGKQDSKGSSNDKNDHDGSKDGDAHSSSVPTSDALKYALPISGAIVGLAALWAIIAFVRSRHLKAPIINAIGVTGVNDPRFTAPLYGGRYGKASNSLATSAYQDVEHEPASIYRNEPNMNLMMGGGIMSDVGVSHLQRKTTGGSKVSRSSSRGVADRLLRNQSRAQRYQQLDATLEEEDYDQVTGYPVSKRFRSNAGVASYLTGADACQGRGYEEAVQEEEEKNDFDRPATYSEVHSYYDTPGSSPVKSNAHAGRGFYGPAATDTSFEACRLESPQRRALPITPYTPNYAAVSVSAPARPRPSGRMYDTPNVNYYPTPVMTQSEGYQPNARLSYSANPRVQASQPVEGCYRGVYAPISPPRRHS